MSGPYSNNPEPGTGWVAVIIGAIIVAILLLACDPIPLRVQARRHQESKLRTCLTTWKNNELYRRQCIEGSAADCADAGLENDCATGDLSTDLPKDRP